jgi:endonuclease YncB( thermonuclease family)
MAKLQLKGEWKLWAGFAAIFILVAFYLYMVSRPPTEGGEYLWRVDKVISSKEFSLRSLGNIIKFRLIAVHVPQSQEQAARTYLTSSLENQWVRIKILRDDPQGTKEGFLYTSGEDIIARMVRQGLAEIDRDEKSFDVRPYMELEQEAKRERKGLWAQSPQGAK